MGQSDNELVVGWVKGTIGWWLKGQQADGGVGQRDNRLLVGLVKGTIGVWWDRSKGKKAGG